MEAYLKLTIHGQPKQNTDYLLGILYGYEYVPVNGQGVYADPALQLGDIF